MKICILNASNPKNLHLESDEYVDFRQGRQSCFDGILNVKQCRSWHAWAYALETEFFVYNKKKWPGVFNYDSVIVLVNRDIKEVIPLVQKLKSLNKKVVISFHESVGDLMAGSGIANENIIQKWKDLYTLVQVADYYLNIFGQMTPFFTGWFGEHKVKFCNHTAPFDWKHGLQKKWEDKPYDVLIGTRSFNQRLPRNTFVTLATLNGWAKKTSRNVHYLSEDGDVKNLINNDLGLSNIIVHRGPLKWAEWLQFLSNFKMLVYFDNSLNLGQVVLDCLMVRTFPIGSTCWNSKLLGTDDSGDLSMLVNMVDELFENPQNRIMPMKILRNKLHPDAVKNTLINLFEESL